MSPMLQEAWDAANDELILLWNPAAIDDFYARDVEELKLGQEPIGYVCKAFGAAV